MQFGAAAHVNNANIAGRSSCLETQQVAGPPPSENHIDPRGPQSWCAHPPRLVVACRTGHWIPPLSLPTAHRWSRRPRPTSSSMTRLTAASRWAGCPVAVRPSVVAAGRRFVAWTKTAHMQRAHPASPALFDIEQASQYLLQYLLRVQVVMKNREPTAQAPGTPAAAAQGLSQRMAAASLAEGGAAATK